MSNCDTSVCESRRAFGPPAGDVTGLGYCRACVLGTHGCLLDELPLDGGQP